MQNPQIQREAFLEDTDRIMQVLDQAMMSDEPRVQDALRRLMVTSALVDVNQTPEQRLGPLREIRQENQDLRRRVNELELKLSSLISHLNRVSLVPDTRMGLGPGIDQVTVSPIESIDISSILGHGHGHQPQVIVR